MSHGFARQADTRAARGFQRQAEVGITAVSNANQFKKLALRHCFGLIAQILKAEACRPGITNDALEHARAALAALEATVQPTPIAWPPVVKDEEE